MQEGSAGTHSEIASPGGELPQAEGEAELAGLGASPSVAARQLPLGGSCWIGLLAWCGGRWDPDLFRRFLADYAIDDQLGELRLVEL